MIFVLDVLNSSPRFRLSSSTRLTPSQANLNYPIGTGGSSRTWTCRNVKLTHPVPKFPTYAFMEWCLDTGKISFTSEWIPVTTARRILVLRMEETASRYGR
jgi:hypothetical protein